MSNDKKWTWDEYPSDGTYFVLRPDRRVFVHSLTESQAKEICDNFNALLSATARVAELEKALLVTNEKLDFLVDISPATQDYKDDCKRQIKKNDTLLTPPQNTKGDDN